MFENYTFLGDLASNILQHDAFSPKDVLVILPNKRAKRVLQKYMAQQIDTPQFSPQILSINEFFQSLSPLKAISKEELILHLYSIFTSFDSFKEEPFQKFLTWAPTFLSDINEIDLQLADASQIYTNLSEIKELETSFMKGDLSEFQSKYLDFYIQLNEIYNQFVTYLKQHEIGYEGLIYREVAELLMQKDQSIDQYITTYSSYKRFIFAGFHALSPSEIAILEYFYHQFNGEFFFDIDHFYDEKYTLFVKSLQNRLRIPDINIKDDFKNIPKDIHITEVTGNMSQIYHAIDLIHQIEESEGNLDQTALVFADESLVVPFVHAYDCTKANLTMGYPIKNTAPYQLLEILLDLTKNSIRFAKIQNLIHKVYYHKDIILFLQNPLIVQYILGGQVNAQKKMTEIVNNNQIFIPQSAIPDFIPDIPNQGLDIVNTLISFFTKLSDKIDSNLPDYFCIQLIIKGLEKTLETLQISNFLSFELDIQSMEYLIIEKLSAISIPFMGDFDKGLQVCGLLETRTLDYKNLIFLSINEGVLPKGKGQPSMIMYDVKNHFNLPTSTYKDSIFAYHFFRLMQRASLIHILYDNDSSSTLSEKSRFINQLEFEVAKNRLQGITIIKSSITTPPNIQSVGDNAIVISKDQRIIDRLHQLNFSPSNLSTYIRCPFAFYLSQIEKLEKPDSVDENIENNVVGSIVHHILEDIFNEVIVDPTHAISILQSSIKNIEELTIESFKNDRSIKKADLTRGKIYLATEIVKKNVVAYLHNAIQEFKNEEIQVLENEVALLSTIITSFGEVKLKGKIDRVDIRDERVTILDYKTGYVDSKKFTLKDEESLINNPDQKQLFQLLFYLLLYIKDGANANLIRTKEYSSGVISFKDVLLKNETYIHYAQLPIDVKNSTINISSETIVQFESRVIQLLDQILNPEIPFIQTDEISNCKYCDFTSICKRTTTTDY